MYSGDTPGGRHSSTSALRKSVGAPGDAVDEELTVVCLADMREKSLQALSSTRFGSVRNHEFSLEKPVDSPVSHGKKHHLCARFQLNRQNRWHLL
jgi:hypothetical protein